MRSEARPGIEQAVADAGHLRVKVGDDLGHRGATRLDTARRARKEGDEGAGEVDVRHAQSRIAASTDQIAGRLSATSDQVLPSSALPYSWPVLVPKYTPTGSSESTAIASRSTEMYALSCGRPAVAFCQVAPPSLVRYT